VAESVDAALLIPAYTLLCAMALGALAAPFVRRAARGRAAAGGGRLLPAWAAALLQTLCWLLPLAIAACDYVENACQLALTFLFDDEPGPPDAAWRRLAGVGGRACGLKWAAMAVLGLALLALGAARALLALQRPAQRRAGQQAAGKEE
jgi:hypothetical protein